MDCWNCGAKIAEIDRKISFRTFCETCQADLHCCKNCKFYQPGRPNDCLIPGTEFISDRQKANFCEEFVVLGTFTASKKEDPKKRFDDLFK